MACCIVAVAGCAGKTAGNTAQQTADEAKEITFDADSAYSFVARQCAFGERVPNTDAHSECGDWIASRLRQCGATVTEQRADLKALTALCCTRATSWVSFIRKRKDACCWWLIGTVVRGPTAIPTPTTAANR